MNLFEDSPTHIAGKAAHMHGPMTLKYEVTNGNTLIVCGMDKSIENAVVIGDVITFVGFKGLSMRSMMNIFSDDIPEECKVDLLVRVIENANSDENGECLIKIIPTLDYVADSSNDYFRNLYRPIPVGQEIKVLPDFRLGFNFGAKQ